MEVKEALIPTDTRQPLLPLPSFNHEKEVASPHQDVFKSQIGKALSQQEGDKPKAGKQEQVEELKKSIEELNRALEMRSIALDYFVDEKTEDIVIKVIELPSEKLIRQIPPEAILRFRGRMKDLLGMLFDSNS